MTEPTPAESAPSWGVADRVAIARAITLLRGSIIEARAHLAVYGPLMAALCADEVRTLRVAMIDADTALSHVRAALDRVRP